jgi:hypothetical protein
MKTKYIRQSFISGLLAVLSVTSLVLLLLQFATPRVSRQGLASLFQSGKMSVLDLYQTYGGGRSFWWANSLREYLLVSLILIVVFSLISFRMARDSK